MTPYIKNANELLNELKTNGKGGLSSAEVPKRKGKYGENKLREKKKKTTIQRFFDQFKDAMILILIAAAIISFVVVCAEQNWGELDKQDFEFYTTYEISRHCKPNPDYYREVLSELRVSPEECPMVGNNAHEDISIME